MFVLKWWCYNITNTYLLLSEKKLLKVLYTKKDKNTIKLVSRLKYVLYCIHLFLSKLMKYFLFLATLRNKASKFAIFYV